MPIERIVLSDFAKKKWYASKDRFDNSRLALTATCSLIRLSCL